MVTNFALAAVCVDSGLYKHIIYESPTLGVEIGNYAEQLKRARDLEYKIADNEGRPPGQYWIDIEPPKVPLSRLAV
jgi:endoribonuclease Dicer